MPSERRYSRKAGGRGTRRALGVTARYLVGLELRIRRLTRNDRLWVPTVVGAVQDVLLGDWGEWQLGIPHFDWPSSNTVAGCILCAHGGWKSVA
jgi:hypothetical protein